MNFFKDKFLILVILILFFAAAAAIFSLFRENKKMTQELASVRGELADEYNRLDTKLDSRFKNLDSKYNGLDSNIEQWDNKILKLKKEGLVETDDFSDLSQPVMETVVLVAGAEDIGALVNNSDNLRIEEISEIFGTGFLLTDDGYIATAKHTVEAIGEQKIMIRTFGGKQYPAKIIILDPQSDIAILKIPGQGYPNISLGFFDNFQAGEEVGLVGFSAGLAKPLVYRGVVSAKGHDSQGAKMFTINAFINKGNSGGPVFSTKTGRVLGIVSARQQDVSSQKFIALPPNYSSSVSLGGVDPTKLSVDLYNETLKIVGDVSQVGIGFVYAADIVRELLKESD